MKATGIIAEYNPLHNGHAYHMAEARRLTGADAVVIAMSGDYVQRGEPAIMDKWVRTEHALKSGADLVLEIPVLFCLGNAGQYASAGVRMLEATGKISHVAFGSESGDLAALTRIAETLRDHDEDIESHIRALRQKRYSYPAARALAYAAVRASIKGSDPETDEEIASDLRILKKPNDILCVEYIRSIRDAIPLAIHREGAGYSDPYDEKITYQSSSAIRAQIFNGNDLSRYVPEHTARSLGECHITGTDHDMWFDVLRYAILTADPSKIEDCPSGGEGLANLLKDRAGSAETWSMFIRRIKSKRYTYTRLSRLCMQLVLGITRHRYDIREPKYLRVLGFSERGRELLAEMRAEGCAELPVIINVNKSARDLGAEAGKLLELDMRASDIYNLMTGAAMYENSDHRLGPVMIK